MNTTDMIELTYTNATDAHHARYILGQRRGYATTSVSHDVERDRFVFRVERLTDAELWELPDDVQARIVAAEWEAHDRVNVSAARR